MKYIITTILAFLCALILCNVRGAEQGDKWTDEEIATAIWYAEGADLATYPYGIRSVKCEGLTECRQVCLNSIRNARKRWIKAGKPEDFIVFMGRRYCPPKAHPKNSNWVRLVKYFLEKHQGD